MKKFFRFLLVLLLIIVAAILILGVIEPKDATVSRSTMIKAPKAAVFEQIVYFKNWSNWSPWYKMDSGKMKMTYYGTDGQPGSGYKWEGDKTGAGDMKDSAVNGTQMDYALTFTKPRTGTAWGYLKADDTAGMTKVTWTINMHFPFPMNAMCVFMNMDKMLGGDFENGLANMKQYVESHASMASTDMDIKEVDYPAHVFEGFRKTVNWADMSKFYMDSYMGLGKDLGGKICGPASAIFYTWDTVNKNTEMVACFPVSDTTKVVKGASVIHVAAGKAVMAVMKGGYSKEMETQGAIAKYMAAKGLTRSMVVEEYAIGQHENPDSTQWITNIYYLVK